MTAPYSILFADRQAILCEGMKCLFARDDVFQVVGSVSSGPEAIKLIQETKPSIVVTDFILDTLTCFDVVKNANEISPQTKVVMLIDHFSDALIHVTLKSSIAGCFLKTGKSAELIGGLKKLMSGTKFVYADCLSDQVLKFVAGFPNNPLPHPSPRELEVLVLRAQGKTTAEVASILGVSAKTVKTYRINLREKLGLDSLESYMHYCDARGLTRQSVGPHMPRG